MRRKFNEYLIVFFLILLTLNSVKSNNKEVAPKATSFLVVEQDSMLVKKYKELERINKEDERRIALKNGLKLIEESLEKKNYDISIKSSLIVGEIFQRIRSFDKAIDVYIKALNIIDTAILIDLDKYFTNKSELNFIRNEILLRIGANYHFKYVTDNIEKAKDSSIVFYNKMIDGVGFETNDKLLGLKAKAYSNLAGIYGMDSLYEKAEDYVNKAIEIHRKQNNKLSEAAALSNLANLYVYQKKYRKAKSLYNRGLELLENKKSSQAIQFKENLYENLGYAMFMLKDYKAYEVQELSHEIKDSLRNVDVRRMIEEVNGEYNVDNVRQAEELKRIKIQNEKEASQKNTWIVGVTGLCTALLLLYLANYYKLRQKNLSLMLSKKELLQNKELDKLKTESQVKILNATMDGKEQERKEIAEILHDNVSALLSSADLHLQASQSQFNGSTPIEIHKTQKIILEASQKIRDLSHTLVSSILLKFGLEYAIKDMAEKFTNSVLEVHTDIGNVRRYDQKSEIKIYNIIQELVNNIIKHSKASNAYVYLNEEEESLTIAIRDDGDGFDMDSAHIKDGVGLNQIKARVHMMEGLFVMNSSEGAGTKTEITVPVTPREKISHV